MFCINVQKCVSLPTRNAFKVPCVREHMMNATKDGRPWKQWVTSNRGKCWFECNLVLRDNHCIFSSLKYGLPSNKCHPSGREI